MGRTTLNRVNEVMHKFACNTEEHATGYQPSSLLRFFCLDSGLGSNWPRLGHMPRHKPIREALGDPVCIRCSPGDGGVAGSF